MRGGGGRVGLLREKEGEGWGRIDDVIAVENASG